MSCLFSTRSIVACVYKHMKTTQRKDMEVATGVGEGHGASSSTELSTGSRIKRDIDTDHGDVMIDVETTGKRT